MSIIIRLQNLPWAAKSIDIRRYFEGLFIPEGGVHIVGGEKGDAFIAFGTDEDARQAMERDGGKIKDMKVKLLLSSRTEMTRVIEQARNQNLSLQTSAAVKAAASDSDRRRPHESSVSPRRKDREKSPRDRERRRSSKRDRSRSRSRSPFRKSRDRDSDRRSDRQRKDERQGDESNDRFKSSREFASEQAPEKVQYGVPDKLHSRQNVEMGRPFDPRIGSAPHAYDSRHGENIPENYNVRHDNVPARNAPYFDPEKPGIPFYHFPDSRIPVGLPPDTKGASEPLQQPNFNSGAFPFDKKTASSGGYTESKRHSPTPATSAPNVGCSAPYEKEFGLPDPYGSNIPQNYVEYPGGYGNAQTAERGAVPAVPNDRRVHTNHPVYGAEPHARYDLIPEANQAGRSSSVPAPKEMAGHDNAFYGKMLPTNMPPVPAPVKKPIRRTRFEPDFLSTQDGQFETDSVSKADTRIHSSAVRQNNPPESTLKGMEGGFNNQRSRPVMGSEAPWHSEGSGANHGSWADADHDMMMQQHSLPNEYHDDDMDIEEENTAQMPPFRGNAGFTPQVQKHNFMRHPPEGRIVPSREHFGYQNKQPIDSSVENKIPPSAHGRFMSDTNANLPVRKDSSNLSLAVHVTGFPSNASEGDVLDLFRGIFIPKVNLIMQRNHQGKINALVKFLNIRDYEEALTRSNKKIFGSVIVVSPCSLATFNNALRETIPFQENSHKTLPSSSTHRNMDMGSEQIKSPIEVQKRQQQVMLQNRAETPARSIPEESLVRKGQAGPPQPAQRYVPTRKLPEIVAQRSAPEVTVPPEKRLPPDSAENQKKQDPTCERKPSESIMDRKPSEAASQRRPTQTPPKVACERPGGTLRNPPDAMHPRKSMDPRQSRMPPESMLPPKVHDPRSERNAFGANQSQKSLMETKHLEPVPPQKPYEQQRKGTEQNAPVIPPPFPRSNLEPCEEDLCIELRGLPYSCVEDEIINFFDGLGILDIFIELGPDGRATGVGFVEFATPADFQAALNLHGKRIGHRYIDILIASKEIMAVARGQRPKPPLLPQGPPREAAPPHAQSQPNKIFCIAINDLPKHIKNHDIANFFAEANLIPRAIHVMLSPNKTPTGEAFAEFNTHSEFEEALRRNGFVLAGSRISVTPITYEGMVDVLGGPPALQGPAGPLLMTPPENDFPPSRRALMPLPGDDDVPPEDHMLYDGPPNRPDYHPDERVRFKHPEPHMGVRPRAPRMRGMPPRPDGVRPRPFLRHGAPQRGPPPFRARHPGPPGYPAPSGCVVGIDNLHFRAGLDELLDFFRDYDVDKNSIIRKYNDNGHVTGEARITFNSHEDAMHAVRELHKKPIMGRPVSLSIV